MIIPVLRSQKSFLSAIVNSNKLIPFTIFSTCAREPEIADDRNTVELIGDEITLMSINESILPEIKLYMASYLDLHPKLDVNPVEAFMLRELPHYTHDTFSLHRLMYFYISHKLISENQNDYILFSRT